MPKEQNKLMGGLIFNLIKGKPMGFHKPWS